jgi:hypothetical protein
MLVMQALRDRLGLKGLKEIMVTQGRKVRKAFKGQLGRRGRRETPAI